MDLNDFKKRLMSEPDSSDPDMLAARRQSTEHMAAARESEAFEARLRTALETPVDPTLSDRLRERVLGEPAAPRRGRLLALVASLAVAALALSLLLDSGTDTPGALREAFIDHLNHNEPQALASQTPVPAATLNAAFSHHGVALDGDLADVTYLSKCRIGGKRGLHLVVTEDDAQVTVMFLPDARLAASESFQLDDISARLVSAPGGVLAFFGHQGQDVGPLSRRVLQTLVIEGVAAAFG